MVRIIIWCIGFLLTLPAMALTQVTATVDKNPVMAKESFILEVVADDDVNANAFDISALSKDFIVGQTSVSSQTSMINYTTTRTTRWTTLLIAKKSGNFVIPAFSIKNQQTTPINLKVLSQSNANKNGNKNSPQDIFVETEVSSTEVYVQQQLSLTVKLHFSVDLKRGNLSQPVIENANFTQIGQDKESSTIINGKRYRVFERLYAISPQKSGQLIVKSPIFSGEIVKASSRRSNFLSFGESKPVSAIGEDLTVSVLPIPKTYQGTWLPSELLSLHQEWQPSSESFIVGEPITRTITLTAAGLSEEQLPAITMPLPHGLKVYPDQTELHTGMNNNRLVSQKVKNFVIVASKTGKFTLPEIIIPWWDTVTDKYQQAVIPSQIITILPNPENITVDNNIENSTTNTASTNNAGMSDSSSISGTPLQKPNTVIIYQSSWLQWLFLALWLLTASAWFISYKLRTRQASVKSSKPSHKPIKNKTSADYTSNKDLYLTLLAACKQNNGELTLNLLTPWVNCLAQTTRQLSSLDEAIIEINDDDFSTEVNELQQFYFGKNSQNNQNTWQGNNLLSIIHRLHKGQQHNDSQPSFSLNP